MKMNFERKSETTNGVTEREYRLNGRVIPRWKALACMAPMFLMAALTAVIFGPVIMIILGISASMIAIVLVIVGAALVPAGIYRLAAGKWPNWFKFEYSKSTSDRA